jgi:GNAT superfamily N-acetyltransferase
MDTIHNTFIDRKGRTIDVGIDFVGNIVAEHNGEVIATWTFDVREEDDHDFLGVADMDKEYERSGIGEHMLIAAEEYFNDFAIVDRFTEEGAAFFNRCRERGISTLNHATFQDDRY